MERALNRFENTRGRPRFSWSTSRLAGRSDSVPSTLLQHSAKPRTSSPSRAGWAQHGPGGAQKQRGAALLIVVALFLVLLPLALMTIFQRSLQNDQFGNSALWRAQSRDAANQAMAKLRLSIAQAIGTGGLLEYQPSPPSWYVTPSAQVQPTSAAFWQSCASNNLCQSTTITLNNNTGRQTFSVLQLATPTGVIDPTLCGTSGYVAVFYNLWVQASASQNPAAGSASEQAVYRACVHP